RSLRRRRGRSRRRSGDAARALGLDLRDELAVGAHVAPRRHPAARAGLRRSLVVGTRRDGGLPGAMELADEGELGAWARDLEAIERVFVHQLRRTDAVGAFLYDVVDP